MNSSTSFSLIIGARQHLAQKNTHRLNNDFGKNGVHCTSKKAIVDELINQKQTTRLSGFDE